MLRTITTYPRAKSPALPTRWFPGWNPFGGICQFVPWRVWLQNPANFNELRVESFDAHAAPEEFQSWTPGQGAFGGLGVRQDGKNTRLVFWREKWLSHVCFTWKTNEFPDEYEVCKKKMHVSPEVVLIKTKSSCPSLGIFFGTYHNGHSQGQTPPVIKNEKPADLVFGERCTPPVISRITSHEIRNPSTKDFGESYPVGFVPKSHEDRR